LLFNLLPAFQVSVGGAWGIMAGGMVGGPGGGEGSAFVGWLLPLINQLLFAAVLILFPLSLRALALGYKSRSLAQDCMKVVIFAAAYAGERLITWILLFVAMKNPMSKAMQWIFIILMWIGFLIFLAQLTFYILLLLRARSEFD
jgi:hypothetical protein